MSQPRRRWPLVSGFRVFLAAACLAAAVAGWMAMLDFVERLSLTSVALAGFAALLLPALSFKPSKLTAGAEPPELTGEGRRPRTRTARKLLLLEGRLGSIIEQLGQLEQTLVTISLQSSQIRERLSLLEGRLDEIEQAHSEQHSALREARENQQQRLQELKQTITAHRQDLSALTDTLAPTNGRPDLHLVGAAEAKT
jgi:TolA-binding protein